jgi:hypothetical protein
MSRDLGDQLPTEVLERFNGRGIESKIGYAYLLVTTDEDGTPRPCMLSAGEVLVTDDTHIRVALWPGTSTSRNLASGSRVLFLYIAPGQVIYAKGGPRELGRAPGSKLERFEITVDRVESDTHKGMPVRETVVFDIEGVEPSEIASQWRSQLEALRQ